MTGVIYYNTLLHNSRSINLGIKVNFIKNKLPYFKKFTWEHNNFDFLTQSDKTFLWYNVISLRCWENMNIMLVRSSKRNSRIIGNFTSVLYSKESKKGYYCWYKENVRKGFPFFFPIHNEQVFLCSRINQCFRLFDSLLLQCIKRNSNTHFLSYNSYIFQSQRFR